MRCQCCKKLPATVQIRDIEDWQISDIANLCDACAMLLTRHLAVAAPLPSAKSGIETLREALPKEEGQAEADDDEMEQKEEEESAVAQLKCGACGMTFKEFEKQGRMGCPDCYEAFAAPIEQLMERIHGDTGLAHVGRKPEEPPADAAAMVHQRVVALKREMERAVKVENYERAAELRDEITRLEKDAAASGAEKTSPKAPRQRKGGGKRSKKSTGQDS